MDNINNLNHIAIIMDGNGRWATQKGLPRIMGHDAGVKALKKIISYANKLGIKELSLFAFSTENFDRPESEVDFLMSLPIRLSKGKMESDVRIHFAGFSDNVPENTLLAIDKLQEKTKDNNGTLVNICFNYGGKADIVNSLKSIMSLNYNTEDVNENLINDYLLVKTPVDLLIRTAGEQRISNFLLWQAAYAEIYFTSTLWPDFKDSDLDEAILEYQKRHRTFGKI